MFLESDIKKWDWAMFFKWHVNMACAGNFLALQNLEITGKYGNRLGKHEVKNWQTTVGIRKYRWKIVGTAIMANGRMLWQVTENY